MKSKGENIIELFNAMRILFTDIRNMIYKFDEIFKNHGIELYWQTNAITSGVSTSLENPSDWFLSGIYRIYKKADKCLYGFNISFRKDSVEPIFIAGKLEYTSDQVSCWDLWDIWYNSEPKEKVFNEKYSYKKGEIDERYNNIIVFAKPLVEINGNEEIEALVKKILSL